MASRKVHSLSIVRMIMECCGKKRAQLLQTIPASRTRVPGEQSSSQRQAVRDAPVYFQYVGNNGLTVIGGKTNIVYRFDRPGMVVAVDPRDKRALEAVSSLREVKGLLPA